MTRVLAFHDGYCGALLDSKGNCHTGHMDVPDREVAFRQVDETFLERTTQMGYTFLDLYLRPIIDWA